MGNNNIVSRWLIIVTALSWGCSTAQFNLLAIVLKLIKLSEWQIRNVISSYSLAVMAATILAGCLTSRRDPLFIAILGGLITLLGIASFLFTINFPLIAIFSSILRGLGSGIFLVSGILYVKSQADNRQQIYYVGLFTSMLMAPTLFIPAISEWLLAKYGVRFFLIVALFPIFISLMFMTIILLLAKKTSNSTNSTTGDKLNYWKILCNKELILPYLSIFSTGMIYGFSTSFLPLYLRDIVIAIGLFFTPFSAIVLVSRFFALKYLQRLPITILAEIGLFAFFASTIALIFLMPIMVVSAGGLLGLGYSIVHPTTTEWASVRYPADQRSRPVALINTFFYLGAVIGPLVIGYLLSMISWYTIIIILSLSVFFVIMAIGLVLLHHMFRFRRSSIEI